MMRYHGSRVIKKVVEIIASCVEDGAAREATEVVVRMAERLEGLLEGWIKEQLIGECLIEEKVSGMVRDSISENKVVDRALLIRACRIIRSLVKVSTPEIKELVKLLFESFIKPLNIKTFKDL